MRPLQKPKIRLLALASLIVFVQCCCLIFPIRWQQRTPDRQSPVLQTELAAIRAPLDAMHINFIAPPARIK